MKVISNNLEVNAVIDRAAKALAWMTLTDKGRATCTWETDFSESEKVLFRGQAKAAITAIREPTNEMVEAAFGKSDLEPHPFRTVWYDMIDVILKE